MSIRVLPDPIRFRTLATAELREAFLISSLFPAGKIELICCSEDRAVVGSAAPIDQPLQLKPMGDLRAGYFTERRELGVLNIGGQGQISVNGDQYELSYLDCLYIGRGNAEISFNSVAPRQPALFYLLSYPAHAEYPTTLVRKADAQSVQLGEEAAANRRTIYKYIHPAGVKSCQLVMGVTELAPGSIWNTMPPHTHSRRSEIYLYFQLPQNTRVFHFMGEPHETRHLTVDNQQAVISPSWSIHSGAGTSAYSFCWGMGGENQAFDDMDSVKLDQLK